MRGKLLIIFHLNFLGTYCLSIGDTFFTRFNTLNCQFSLEALNISQCSGLKYLPSPDQNLTIHTNNKDMSLCVGILDATEHLCKLAQENKTVSDYVKKAVGNASKTQGVCPEKLSMLVEGGFRYKLTKVLISKLQHQEYCKKICTGVDDEALPLCSVLFWEIEVLGGHLATLSIPLKGSSQNPTLGHATSDMNAPTQQLKPVNIVPIQQETQQQESEMKSKVGDGDTHSIPQNQADNTDNTKEPSKPEMGIANTNDDVDEREEAAQGSSDSGKVVDEIKKNTKISDGTDIKQKSGPPSSDGTNGDKIGVSTEKKSNNKAGGAIEEKDVPLNGEDAKGRTGVKQTTTGATGGTTESERKDNDAFVREGDGVEGEFDDGESLPDDAIGPIKSEGKGSISEGATMTMEHNTFIQDNPKGSLSKSDGISSQRTYNNFVEAEDSHFFAYFMTLSALCILGYLVYHNKRKIIAMAVEGKKNRSTGRRRPNSASYHKLDSNLEEAMSSNYTSSNSYVIY